MRNQPEGAFALAAAETHVEAAAEILLELLLVVLSREAAKT